MGNKYTYDGQELENAIIGGVLAGILLGFIIESLLIYMYLYTIGQVH